MMEGDMKKIDTLTDLPCFRGHV